MDDDKFYVQKFIAALYERKNVNQKPKMKKVARQPECAPAPKQRVVNPYRAKEMEAAVQKNLYSRLAEDFDRKHAC